MWKTFLYGQNLQNRNKPVSIPHGQVTGAGLDGKMNCVMPEFL